MTTRIVMDTNVLISGTFWTSPSFHILQNINTGKIVLIVSPAILREYDDVLHRDEILDKTAYSRERAQAAAKIVAKAMLVEPAERIKAVKDDPDDDKFLEAAIAGNASHIVSQDNHLLSLKEFRGIKILTPEDFLAH
jgi:putative PIN family toxin of toxin-antitoxin system